MNKVKFNIKNYLLAGKFTAQYKIRKQEFPRILSYLDKSYGSPVFVDDYSSLDHWKITDRTDWGSARPETLCTYVKENIMIKAGSEYNSMVIKTTPEPATGKGWNGEEISRPISSGFVASRTPVVPGQVISATVNTSESYPGSWFSFWLFKKDVPGDERYREVDIFEKIMERKNEKQYRITVHGGIKSSKEMLSISYPLFYVNEDKMTFTCELHDHKVKVFVNGVHLFVADEPDYKGEYDVILGDGPSTHNGKVSLEEIVRVLPRKLEVLDFRVHSL